MHPFRFSLDPGNNNNNNSNVQDVQSTVSDYCEKIKEETDSLMSQIQKQKQELEKLSREKIEMDMQYKSLGMHEYALRMETHRMADLSLHLKALIINTLPHLHKDVQEQVIMKLRTPEMTNALDYSALLSNHPQGMIGAGMPGYAMPHRMPMPVGYLPQIPFHQFQHPQAMPRIPTVAGIQTMEEGTQNWSSEEKRSKEQINASEVGRKTSMKKRNADSEDSEEGNLVIDTNPTQEIKRSSKIRSSKRRRVNKAEESEVDVENSDSSQGGFSDEVPREIKRQGSFKHGGEVRAVIFGYNSYWKKHLLYSGGDNFVKIWDFYNTEECLHVLNYSDSGIVRSMKLIEDGKTLVVGGEADSIKIWDVACPSPKIKNEIKLKENDATYSMVITPDSKTCIVSGKTGLSVWDLHNKKVVRTFDTRGDTITSLDISRDGREIWSAGLNGVITSWSLTDGRVIKNFNIHRQIYSLCCSPIDDILAVGTNNDVQIINSLNEKNLGSAGCKDRALSVKFSDNGKWLVSTDRVGVVKVYGYPNWKISCQMDEKSLVSCCDISEGDTFIATGSQSNGVTFYMSKIDVENSNSSQG